MATPQQAVSQQPPVTTLVPNQLDRYVVIHIATTCDEHAVFVSKDSAEVIEIGWILIDAKTLDELHRESVLVKPQHTPITPLCTSLTTITYETIRTAGDFRNAITRIDEFVRDKIPPTLEFAFVTFDAWDLRVQLPREARDKAVVLPAYLQHSRTFDLRTEYSFWQQYHPETLPYTGSSISNICTALSVEAVKANAPIKHNLPFHLQALAPQSPRRALEEAVTLARVLRSLINKSQPHHEHQNVMMHPMDARRDVRAFLGERSKVLYLNGLPHDTTQSELESWFTQYGGRPIAFWTVRTPDQHKPTGTGFAVFSSHEEAAESLCMNGRALNEKSIEVSPSSNKVLERTQETLAPFPPSKNRPRPGDWTCPSCGFSNFQRRTACFRCSFPAMQAGPPSDMNMGFSYGFPPAPPPMMQHYGNHSTAGTITNRLGASAPFRPGDWRCGQQDCLYHNFAKNQTCLRCGSSRADALVISEGPTMNFNAHPNFGIPPHHGQQPPAGPPGPMGGSGGFPSNPGNFGPPGPGFGPPSGYGVLPSGLGGPPGAYGFPAPNGGMQQPGTGFDSRAAEAAFTAAGANPPGPPGALGAPPGMGMLGANGGAAGFEGNDPFGFLGSGFGSLSLDEARRNGAVGSSGKPA